MKAESFLLAESVKQAIRMADIKLFMSDLDGCKNYLKEALKVIKQMEKANDNRTSSHGRTEAENDRISDDNQDDSKANR
tara:strand:- start:302 stop:538 length:237 start_codon:yes stop_codon:yes gene_type:complete